MHGPMHAPMHGPMNARMNAPLAAALALPPTVADADRAFAQAAAQFFTRYAAAFTALDADAVAALYAEPALIVDGDRGTSWPDRAAIRDNMAALCNLYRARGLQHAQLALRQAIAQGADAGYVDVHWTLHWMPAQDGSTNAPTQFHTGYLLHRIAGCWLLRLCTAYEETL